MSVMVGVTGRMEYDPNRRPNTGAAIGAVVSNRMDNQQRDFEPELVAEREPRANNSTEVGRQLNCRVELYIKPVVIGR